MKRILLFILTLSLLLLAATGCEIIDGITGKSNDEDPHTHTGGTATCKSEAICTVCGEPYGEKRMSHDYYDATCIAPKTCKDCGVTFGLPLGHSYEAATCQSASTCTVCGHVKGEPLAHKLTPATCKAPKTCQDCGYTEGGIGDHNYSAPTCDTPATCKTCGATSGDPQHTFNTYYSYDDDGHWIACAKCDARKDAGTHRGGEATTTSRAKCEICGARYGEATEVTINWKTQAVTPADNSKICLANQGIITWRESFDYRTTDTNGYMTGEDIFLPVVPVFEWTVGEAADYYKLYLADNEGFMGAQCYLTTTCELAVEHLYVGRDYYWFVDAVYDGYTVRSGVFTFSTANTPRTVCIDGVSNSRDIGGYVTADGKVIKQGMIYRSAKLDDITEVGKYTLLNVLGVKTDLDLRGARTVGSDGTVYNDMKNATAPVAELNHITVACPWYCNGDNGIWYDEFNKAEFAKAIKVFADPDNYPIIFHCSLGRDRTGTLALVIEGLLGLDEQTLMMEYELSAFSFWGAYNANFNTSLRNSIHDTYLYINNNYEGNSFSEKVEDFLLEIGVTSEEIASIKNIMLEEVE